MCDEPGARPTPTAPAELWWDVAVPDGLALEPVDAVTVTVVVDNAVDLLADQPGVRRFWRDNSKPLRPVPTMVEGASVEGLVAEHGFAAVVRVSGPRGVRTLLFDTGASPRGAAGNLRRLGLAAGDLEAIVLSHGHWDHTGGLGGLAEALGGPAKLPVVLHPHGWRQRRQTIPGHEPRNLPTPSRAAIEDLGFAVLDSPRPTLLLDGAILVTGEVARTTGYEPGLPGQEARVNGTWRDDRATLDDQALVVDVADRGLVVITGCGHAGVVNICRWAQRLSGGRPVYGVIGGFHLGGPTFLPLLPRILDELATLGPGLLMGGHCTGWRAQTALADRFPDAALQSVVGAEVTVATPSAA